eukprot:CAMPEP_0178921430 /NCGR_PEP_ID=MMETSP0786-20121207/15558_1 /TAXON_ID=186022 /ORGANISM="Thalassionema frauenfeldii, Strain CCMP 1798" /LENGTH=146 /DNA_ID=CAMNT_0020595611 /DNA_START=187 /DNA_END=624 /DNA_ORIENTATION=-
MAATDEEHGQNEKIVDEAQTTSSLHTSSSRFRSDSFVETLPPRHSLMGSTGDLCGLMLENYDDEDLEENAESRDLSPDGFVDVPVVSDADAEQPSEPMKPQNFRRVSVDEYNSQPRKPLSDLVKREIAYMKDRRLLFQESQTLTLW